MSLNLPVPGSDQAIAQVLVEARRHATVVDADTVPMADAAQAYRVQAEVAREMHWFAEDGPRFWK